MTSENIIVNFPKQIPSRSQFNRKKNLAAGPGIVFAIGNLKAIIGDGEIYPFIRLCKKAINNSNLFPEKATKAENPNYAYYRISDINQLISQNKGVVSFTFFCAYCKNGNDTCRDVIFSIQLNNNELF